jgi:hypothetical protein
LNEVGARPTELPSQRLGPLPEGAPVMVFDVKVVIPVARSETISLALLDSPWPFGLEEDGCNDMLA